MVLLFTAPPPNERTLDFFEILFLITFYSCSLKNSMPRNRISLLNDNEYLRDINVSLSKKFKFLLSAKIFPIVVLPDIGIPKMIMFIITNTVRWLSYEI